MQAGTADKPYYTNSSQLPVGWTDDPSKPWRARRTAEQIHRRHRAAPVHGQAAVERRGLPRPGQAFAHALRLPYITITPTFSICPTHGYLAGEHKFCPTCDEERLQAVWPQWRRDASPIKNMSQIGL